MPKLILIKHAKPAIIPNMPAKSWLLSEEGQKDAEAFALKLKIYEPQQIFSSPEPKALETALTLTHGLKIPFSIVDDLHEHQRANEPYDLDHAVFVNKVKNLFNSPDKLVYGEETANQARARFHVGLLGAWRKFRDNNIAVVAHGTVISLFVAHVLPSINGFELWNCLKMPDAVVLDTVDFSHFTLVKGCE